MNPYEAAALVNRLKPGQWLSIEPAELDYKPAPEWFPIALRKPEEIILDNVIGSAYEIRFWIDLPTGRYFFERLKEPLRNGWRTRVDRYQAPYFEQDVSGFFRPKERKEHERDRPFIAEASRGM